MSTFPSLAITSLCAALLSACAGPSSNAVVADKPFNQDGLPELIKVPAGNTAALQTVGSGEITYECRAKADAPAAFSWVFVGPQADLLNRSGTKVGTYYGPPATWAALDGSKITGTQVAVAPLGAGNIPGQLVKANPAVGTGAMSGVTYVQRVATLGGVAPASLCDATTVSRKEVVKYRADYIFWKAA